MPNPAQAEGWSLAELAARFGGEVAGPPETRVRRVATVASAEAGDLTFLSNPKYFSGAGGTHASAILLPRSLRDAFSIPRILCDDPYLYFARVAALLAPPRAAAPGVHPSAVVGAGAVISGEAEVGPLAHVGAGASIGPGAIVGAGSVVGEGAAIGAHSLLHPRVVVAANCVLGARAVVHSGAVIGADGFGFANDAGRWVKIPQTGRVVIGDDVEIGANTTIDRGALDDTVIENGVKLDNQIQIGHNVHIGAHTAIAGCVAIAGSTRVGRRCTLAGACAIVGHVTLADDVHVSAATLVTKSISTPGTYTGVYPFEPHAKWSRTAARLRRIEELAGRVDAVEARLKDKKFADNKAEAGSRAGADNKEDREQHG